MTLALAATLVLMQDGAQIEELIKRLGSEEYSVREKASEELRKIGKPALEALRKAAESPDPEVRTRAKSLLQELAEPGEARTPPRPAPPAPPPFPPGLGLRGSSVQVRSVNGDSTYVITPGDGGLPITFRRTRAGEVTLEYTDGDGKAQSAASESLGKFLKDHAELAVKYGITEEGIDYGGGRVSFKGPGLEGFRFDFGRRPFRPAEPPRDPEAPRADFEPASEALRAQLGLEDGQGVVATRDEAAPGLRKNDVLVEVDGRPVRRPADVKPLLRPGAVLTVLRKGRRQAVTIRRDF